MDEHKTPAARAYVLAVGIWAAVYVALIWALSTARNSHLLTEPWNWLAAWTPSIPIAGIMLALLTFMRDSDEYVRALTTRRLIFALLVTQVLCSAWGFLEVYAGAQHLELYLVVPVFWAAYGLVCPFIRSSS
jgi:putative oxidoreductase